MSRGYDLGGRHLWVESCSVVNAGSHGNDGEGIMGQRHNHIEIYSWAFTHSRQYVEDLGPDTIGENGWIGGYDIDSFGFLLLSNRCDGSIGLLSATGNNDLLDTANVGNYDNFGSPAAVAVVPDKVNPPLDYFDDGLGSGAIGGLPTDPPTAPTGLTATAMSDNRGVALSWTDTTTNETGFRVERRINGGDWKVIAYRPRISLSKSSGLTDPWSPATLVSNINNPVWEDYTAPRGQAVQYRVFAIDQNDDSSYGSSITPPVTVGSSIPTTPTSLTWLVVGSNLQLSWPSAYTGWELQSQTNSTGLGTNWGTVPNSSSTNQIVVPINPLTRSVFYRLYYSP
jgi:hypothetical protein